MTKRIFRAFLTIVLSFYGSALADVPPDAGYVRQSVSLTLETHDDLSEYRFFLESPISLEEIKISTGEPTIIGRDGRVGAARIGTLWAIPRTSIGELGVEIPGKVDAIQDALREGRIKGAAKLLTHDFQATIREAERAGWTDPVYKIERNREKDISAVLISGGARNDQVGGNLGFGFYSIETKTSEFWTAVIGGAILTLFLISLGAWTIRRSRLKMTEADSPTK